MSSPSTVPMIAPDGTVGDIPQSNVSDAVKGGFKIGADMLAPDGKTPGVIPLEGVHEAIGKGFSLVGRAPSPPVPSALQEYDKMDNAHPDATPAPTGFESFGVAPIPMSQRDNAVIADAAKAAPVGAVKGAASTVNTAGRAAQFLVNKGSGLNLNVVPKNPELLQPSDNEKPGYTAEQMGEFLLPGTLLSKLGKAGEAAVLAKNGVSTVDKLPFAARTLLALGKGGLEAGSAGGVEALHGGDPGDIAKTAATAGGIATAGELLPMAANVAKERATELYQKALAPTKPTTKFLAENKVVPGLLQRGEYGSLKNLSGKAADNMADVGDQMNSLMAARGSQTMDTKPILDSLDKVKQKYIVNGVPLNEDAIKPIQDMQQKIADMGQSTNNQVSYDSLRKAKQVFDDPVAAKGGYAGVSVRDKYVLNAQKSAANAIRTELAKTDPDMAKLNAEYSFWSNVGDVVDSTISRRVGQQGGILGSGAAEVVGAAAGGAPGAMLASGANLAKKAATSGVIRTFRGVQWNKLGNALANKDIPGMMKIAARLAAATSAQSATSRQQ